MSSKALIDLIDCLICLYIICIIQERMNDAFLNKSKVK